MQAHTLREVTLDSSIAQDRSKMWPIWLIVAVAVGGAVSLTVTAVLTVVYFERRRYRTLMARHELNRNSSQMHRHHLSVTDVDISTLPKPTKSLRHSYHRPRSISGRFYATIPSQEEVRAFPEGTIMDSVVDTSHCQVEADQSHQWLSTTKTKRLKRKKKIAKVSTCIAVTASPMSAITETTEPSRMVTPEPVELPAHATPRITPERNFFRQTSNPMSVKVVQVSRLSINSILGIPERNQNRILQRISHGTAMKSRSISLGSIAPPPDVPLPPIPDATPYGHQRQMSLSRSKSDISIHRRGSSAQNPQNTPGSVQTISRSINKLSGFKFELSQEELMLSRSQSRLSSNHTRGASTELSLKTTQETFQFPHPYGSRTPEIDNSLKTIDASTWNLPQSMRSMQPMTPTFSTLTPEAGSRSVSMIDYDAILSAGNSLNNSPTRPHEGPLSRPVSAMSITSADMFRLSVIGSKAPESPRVKGHKRQNCVRIKNLTPVDVKKRLSSQLGRLAEAEEDNASILLPSPDKAGSDLRASKDDSSSAVPIIKKPQALSLRVKRPGWVSVKDKNMQARPLPSISTGASCSRPSIDLKSPIVDPTTRSEDSEGYKATNEVPATVLEAVQTSGGSETASSTQYPVVFQTISPERRKTLIQGPRNAPPPSLRVRNQTRTGSPLRRKSSESERVSKQHLQLQRDRKTSDADLRKSIAMLKNMTLPEAVTIPTTNIVQSSPTLPFGRIPSSRYAASPALKIQKTRMRSNTVAGHAGERTQSRPAQPESIYQKDRGLLQVQIDTPPTQGKFTYSPSSISIWEDDSVKADSPELPSIQPSLETREVSVRRPSLEKPTSTGRYSPVKSHRDHFDQLSTYSRNVSLHQQHQLSLSPQIQREALWKLQQDADIVTSRALALGNTTNADNFLQPRRVVSPKAKLQGLYDSVPAPFRGSVQSQSTQQRRGRSQTVSAAARPSAQTACEGIGLGLKFGDKSMAYTVNEMEKDGIGRLR